MSQFVKIKFECSSCEKKYVVAYREDMTEDLPEFCPFCGDNLPIPQAEDDSDES